MYIIKKTAIENAPVLPINRPQWGFTYDCEINAYIAYDDEGVCVRFTLAEKDPLRKWHAHLDPVHEDSCVEFFVNFTPDASDLYFNFEVNANGAMDVSIRRDRYDSNDLTVEEIESLGIKAQIFEESWQVDYKIPYALIKHHFPTFDPENSKIIRANLYKCGHRVKKHYLAAYDLGCPSPDFHRPEYFVEIAFER